MNFDFFKSNLTILNRLKSKKIFQIDLKYFFRIPEYLIIRIKQNIQILYKIPINHNFKYWLSSITSRIKVNGNLTED